MKLSILYPTLSTEERETLAKKAGIGAPYLWQLANKWKDKRPSLTVIEGLAAADKRLTIAELVDEFTDRQNETPTPRTPTARAGDKAEPFVIGKGLTGSVTRVWEKDATDKAGA